MSDDEQTLPDSDPIPESGRVIGIDFGTARIGVAVSDPNQAISSPLEIRQVQNAESDARYFLALVDSERAVGFVVGLPLHMSGDASQKSREAVAFAKWLRETTGLPVAFNDERYSTAKAKEICEQLGLRGPKRKTHLDKIAAQVILASWLERIDRTQNIAQPLEDKPIEPN